MYTKPISLTWIILCKNQHKVKIMHTKDLCATAIRYSNKFSSINLMKLEVGKIEANAITTQVISYKLLFWIEDCRKHTF